MRPRLAEEHPTSASPTPYFAGRAPLEVVAECQANLAEAQAQAELVRGRLAELE